MESIHIPLSKRKLTLSLAGSILFVIAGVYFLRRPEVFLNPVMRSSAFIFMVGLAAVIFFGVLSIFLIRKLFDKRPGLIIDENGINDNSSGVSAGIVPWTDIKGIDTASVQRQRFILLMVTNPDKYLERQTGFKQRMMKINYRMYQTPVCISANGLQCNFDELYRIVKDNYAKYKR